MPTLTAMNVADVELRVGSEHVDVDWLHQRLSTDTYWATGRSRQRVVELVANSLCYSAFDADGQIGFARLVSDRVTFGWLSDVYVDRRARGTGVVKRLMGPMLADAQQWGLRRVLLATDDAAELYRRFGFEPVEGGSYEWMALTWPHHPA
jgi:N-acetylglutamate synthase-like GNAT family acetyltransferase